MPVTSKQVLFILTLEANLLVLCALKWLLVIALSKVANQHLYGRLFFCLIRLFSFYETLFLVEFLFSALCRTKTAKMRDNPLLASGIIVSFVNTFSLYSQINTKLRFIHAQAFSNKNTSTLAGP